MKPPGGLWPDNCRQLKTVKKKTFEEGGAGLPMSLIIVLDVFIWLIAREAWTHYFLSDSFVNLINKLFIVKYPLSPPSSPNVDLWPVIAI